MAVIFLLAALPSLEPDRVTVVLMAVEVRQQQPEPLPLDLGAVAANIVETLARVHISLEPRPPPPQSGIHGRHQKRPGRNSPEPMTQRRARLRALAGVAPD